MALIKVKDVKEAIALMMNILEKNEKITTVRMIKAEPKVAKKTFKEYAEENPGIYSLYQVYRVEAYFTEKEI